MIPVHKCRKMKSQIQNLSPTFSILAKDRKLIPVMKEGAKRVFWNFQRQYFTSWRVNFLKESPLIG